MSLSTEIVGQKLSEKFGDAIVSDEQQADFHIWTVKREKIFDIIQYLYEDSELQFQFLTTLCGIHYPDNAPDKTMCVMYQLHNLPGNHRIRLKVYFSENDKVMPTITPIFRTANWMEREAFDFYGVVFKGHPNLKKILNMEDQEFFPMLKYFPLEDPTRDDKDDTMFGRKMFNA
ncbi:MAG: NADH-quinone oxidoreductase subunit C [Bacteroidia bacterium]|nr:NADH-quinone oxidoreductase subunit C [Bacteroidia bacterium]